MKFLIVLRKIILIWAIWACSFSFGHLNDYQNEVDTLLNRFGGEQFIKDVKFVQSIPDITYADERHYSVKNYEQFWEFWKRLNINRYEEELRNLIQINYNLDDLKSLSQFYRNGLGSKLLKSIYQNSLFIKMYNDLLTGKKDILPITDERMRIINNLYKFLGLVIVEQNIFTRMNSLSVVPEDSYEIKDLLLQKTYNIKAESFSYFSKNIKNQIIFLLMISLKKFSDHELNSFITQMNSSTIRSICQLYLNFHFLYVLDLILSQEYSLGLIKLDVI